MPRRFILLAILVPFLATSVMTSLSTGTRAAPPEPGAQATVQLPLNAYSKLTDAHAVAPVGATLSKAEVTVVVPEDPNKPAQAEATVTVHVLRDGWVTIPLLPRGTPVLKANVGGKNIALTPLGASLAWSVQGKGVYTLKLSYSAPTHHAVRGVNGNAGAPSGLGGSLQLPLPAAASLSLQATLPSTGLQVTVLPSSEVTTAERSGLTVVKATLPRASGVQLAWQSPGGQPFLVTSAVYSGKPGKNMMAWTALLKVRLLSDAAVAVPVLDNEVALRSALLDGEVALIEERDDQMVVRLKGKGEHVVKLDFETPIKRESGPTSTEVWLPRPPLTTLNVELTGEKEVTVTPAGGVDRVVSEGVTRVTVRLPPTDTVGLSWSDALPEDVDKAVRANAEVHHVVSAEEGVLQLTAIVSMEVTRGRTSRLSGQLPAGVVVNRVQGQGVTDWRVTAADGDGGVQNLSIYLDHEVSGSYRFRVFYEKLLGTGTPKVEAIDLPLLEPQNVHRQRGMVALTVGTELEMKPAPAAGMSGVGENQLPQWLRKELKTTVTHTYKYVDPSAQLAVSLQRVERRKARFAAEVDTLVSVSDGVLRVAASVGITVKSGSLMELDLRFPDGVSLLSATAPSLRDHRLVETAGKPRLLRLQFNREVEGNIRIEVGYERVLMPDEDDVAMPALHVVGASPERGRLAVEALSAVEVQAAKVERLHPVDVQELPRQLVLRTTNPILLAYKYVHAEPPFALNLTIKRHEELAVHVAAIDEARYETLYTRDGIALTRARYQVRNRHKQFLQVALPPNSEVWSAQLAGQPVKPARGDKPSTVLVPLLNSSASFVVELVFATTIGDVGFVGSFGGELPVPDIVETRTRWDVYLPEGLDYGTVKSSLTLDQAPAHTEVRFSAEATAAATADGKSGETSNSAVVGPAALRLDVPRRGVHLRLTGLLANQGRQRAAFTIGFNGAGASALGALLMTLAGLLLMGLALRLLGFGLVPPPRVWVGVGIAGLGLGVMGGTVLGTSWAWGFLGVALAAGAQLVRALSRRVALARTDTGEALSGV